MCRDNQDKPLIPDCVEARPPRFAFFDVDETVVRFKSMFAFEAFWSRNVGLLPAVTGPLRNYHFAARIARYARQGRSREFINALYYERFSGRSQSLLTTIVARWFEEAKRIPGGIYISPTLNEIHHHQREGTRIVLVSGSFHELLDPIAKDLAVDHVLATRLKIRQGHYTGQIEQPQMIGYGKAFAIRSLLSQHQADPSACWAYGDHVSDINMLEEVGHPNIVSCDPSMLALAGNRGWRVINPGLSPRVKQSGF